VCYALHTPQLRPLYRQRPPCRLRVSCSVYREYSASVTAPLQFRPSARTWLCWYSSPDRTPALLQTATNAYQHRLDNIVTFLRGSFQAKVEAAEGSSRPKTEAGWVLGKDSGCQWVPSQPAIGGSVIFHCFGHWKGLSWTKSVNSE